MRKEDTWCMCVKLQAVARDMRSTCSICGGRDAYKTSMDRPEKRHGDKSTAFKTATGGEKTI